MSQALILTSLITFVCLYLLTHAIYEITLFRDALFHRKSLKDQSLLAGLYHVMMSYCKIVYQWDFYLKSLIQIPFREHPRIFWLSILSCIHFVLLLLFIPLLYLAFFLHSDINFIVFLVAIIWGIQLQQAVASAGKNML